MSAAGDVLATANSVRSTCLLAGVTAVNNPPALATDGIPVYPTNRQGDKTDGVCYGGKPSRESVIFAKGVASGGSPSLTLRLWGYSKALGEWVPVGAGADSTKGTLNAGAAMGPVKTNKVLHSESFLLAGQFDRLYLEVVAIAGTTMTVDAWIATARTVGY